MRGGGGEEPTGKPDHLHLLFNILRSLGAKNRGPGGVGPGGVNCEGVGPGVWSLGAGEKPGQFLGRGGERTGPRVKVFLLK